MALPERLTIHNFTYHLDGGTTVFHASDETGHDHGIMLVQHSDPRPAAAPQAIPGRLYFDGQLVPLRSDVENRVIVLLQEAAVRCGEQRTASDQTFAAASQAVFASCDLRQVFTSSPEENINMLRADVTGFVQSAAYLDFAERVDQALDPLRYTVWAAWEPSTRKHVVVRLGRLLGIGLKAAQELLDAKAPIASGLSALQVADLGGKFAREGVLLRIEPAYRWPLS